MKLSEKMAIEDEKHSGMGGAEVLVEYIEGWADEVAQLEAELGDFRDRRDERFQMYEDCKVENEALKREIERLRELPERIKRMCYVKEAWQADGALCDIEDYIDSLLEGSE